jgi:hypothetical protein
MSLTHDPAAASTVLMRIHRITFVTASIAIATMMGILPPGACRSQLALRAAGFAFNVTTPEEISEKHTDIFDSGLI